MSLGADLDLDGDFHISYAPGTPDAARRFMGGTEIRVLGAHAGKLYAGNGDWRGPGRGLRGCRAHKSLSSTDPRRIGGLNMHSMIACRTGVRTTLR